MTGPTGPSTPRGRLRADLIYLGWRAAIPLSEPALPETTPAHPARAPLADEVSSDWLAAQRREHALLARPAWIAAGTGTLLSALAAAGWLAAVVPAAITVPALAAGLIIAGAGLRSALRDRAALRAQIAAERRRVDRFRAVQQVQQATTEAAHASRLRAAELRHAAAARQPGWRPAAVPVSVNRIDVAGGTLRGWSALLTMLAAARLAAGAEVTVVDLTEGAVAADLVALAAGWGLRPLVWVLPADLPRLDLGSRLPAESLADVLALTAAAADAGRTGPAADPARDAALLAGVLDVLGPERTLADVLLALRTLAQIGGPRQPDTARLTPEQLTILRTWSGKAAESLVIDRAWALAARLRVLGPLGSALEPLPPSPLRIACAGRLGSAVGNQLLGAYLTVALTEVLRQAAAGQPWHQTICLLGAERLPGDALDRLSDAAEAARAGLVLGYRTVPPAVRDRLGRGQSAVAFMRLGNAAEARAAAEQIGTEHRFVLSQLTDTIGGSVTDTVGDSYTSTVGTADSVSDSVSATLTYGRSQGRGRSAPGGFAPFGAVTGSASRDRSSSSGFSDSRSVTAGINASTSWGRSTSRAIGANSSLAGSLQRSRELVVEQHELQHLPETAVLLCADGPSGREVILADANPAIMTLPNATLAGAGQPAAPPPLRYRP